MAEDQNPQFIRQFEMRYREISAIFLPLDVGK